MKNAVITFLILAWVYFMAEFLFQIVILRTHLDRQPEITNFNVSTFDFSSSKPFYFVTGDSLFY